MTDEPNTQQNSVLSVGVRGEVWNPSRRADRSRSSPREWILLVNETAVFAVAAFCTTERDTE